jgi:tight adherence protein C
MGRLSALISVLAGASVALAGKGAALESARRGALLQTLGVDRKAVGSRGPSKRATLVVRLLAGIGSTQMASQLCRFERIRRRHDLAGRPLTPEAINGTKVVLACACGLPCFLGDLPVLVAAFLAAAVGYAALRVPDVLLARMAKRRQRQIGDRVPDLVELLVATTEAGLSPMVAFRRSAQAMQGPLGEELREAGRHIDLGGSWRETTEQLVKRTEAPSLRRLSLALTRSHRLGTSVGSALRNLAEDLRGERRARAEEMARRAPVKMLFPLVFLILPAFLLLTVGPVVLATIRSLH